MRTFGLSSFAVDNATSVFLIALIILIFGIQSYQHMPKEQFPEVDWPTVYINTPYFGNSAADIENLVTRPLEKELQSITGLKDIKSTSMQDYSVITVEFESDMDIDEAVRKVKDAVDKAKPELPGDLDQDPTVLDVNLSEIPIVTIFVSGDYSNDEHRSYAEYLEEKIEEIDEITRVELKGTLEREVKVDVDLMKMDALKVSFRDIENAISAENITMSGGELVSNDFRRAIRVKGEFESVEELENMIVKSEDQRPIFLKDIAIVTFGYQDRSSIARADLLPVISLDVIKRQGENLLAAADAIREVVEEAGEVLPDDVKISLFNDQSVYPTNEVSNLENSTIPLSMLMGILILYWLGVTMNMVVLFALILALGLLVDNAIVVVENIYRYFQEGYSPVDAAKYGAGEVAMPIIASTATTLAAFVPLAFWPGIMGSFMQYLPITLIIVLTSSLFVALVINPVFTSRFMIVDEKADDVAVRRRRRRNVLILAAVTGLVALAFALAGITWGRNLFFLATAVTLVNYFVLRPASFRFQNKVLPRLEAGYDHFIRAALRVPWLVFSGTFFLLFAALALLAVRTPKVIFFPNAQPIYVNVFVELPLGTDIEATNGLMEEMEEKVLNAIDPYAGIVEAVLSQIGENTSDPNGPPEPGVTPNKARITVAFVPAQERGDISTWDVMEDIRASVQGYPGVQVTVDKNANGPATGKPINLEIQGEEIDSLVLLSDRLISYLNQQNIPGIEELQADIKIGKPEMIVRVDRDAARRYEISTFDIASAIRTAVVGKEVSKFKQGEEEYPITVRLEDRYRNNIDALLNQKITFRNASTGQISQVPISAVADIEYTSTFSSIKRKDLDRVVTVYSNVLEGYNANEIIAQLDEAMNDYPLPVGFSYEFTGQQQQQAEDMGFLNTAFLIALFAIFLIIVAQFNSVMSPFIIILSVLFSTIGVFLGYAFTGMDISVIFTGVGIISLAGVVVNNAIVLIDYTYLLIRRKLDRLGKEDVIELDDEEIKESIVQAGSIRLRPVLLTAITTVLGLVPLAIGFNFNFFTLISESDPHVFIGGDNTAIWGPMAWTVIYGLVFATFLTLIVVPSMFWLTLRRRRFSSRLFSRRRGRQPAALAAAGGKT